MGHETEHTSTSLNLAELPEHPLGGLGQDAIVFNDLYRQYLTPVYKYFFLHVGNHHDAEDLTAATFAKAVASLHRYQEQGKLAAWLFSIARHTLLDFWRRHREHVDLDLVAEQLIGRGRTVEDEVIQKESVGELRHFIGELPADQKQVVLLRFLAQLSTAEVAAALGRSEGSVKMLLHRAIAKLRDLCLAEEQG